MKFFLFEPLLGFFKRCQKEWNSFFFCKPKKLKKHESNFYEAVKLSKSLKTASKDPVLVPGKCSSFWTESGSAPIPKHCSFGDFSYIFVIFQVLGRFRNYKLSFECIRISFQRPELLANTNCGRIHHNSKTFDLFRFILK